MPAAPVPAVPVTMTPVDLLRLKMVDLILADQSGLRRIAMRGYNALCGLDRRQWRRVRAGSKRRRSCEDSKTEFDEFPTFHFVSSCSTSCRTTESFVLWT
jgi:hypothetical protein